MLERPDIVKSVRESVRFAYFFVAETSALNPVLPVIGLAMASGFVFEADESSCLLDNVRCSGTFTSACALTPLPTRMPIPGARSPQSCRDRENCDEDSTLAPERHRGCRQQHYLGRQGIRGAMDYDREFLTGTLSVLILSLLAERPMYGYEILQEAERRQQRRNAR